MNRNLKLPLQAGFGLMEVLIAIVIFAIGMLALASLQGSLTRSSTDANLRTTAAHIAERTIEDLRGFGMIDTDPAGLINAYNDIVTEGATTITDGGIPFTRSITVTDWYYDVASDTFEYAAPAGIAVSDFKEVEVTVAWGADAGFQTDDENAITSADLGSGEIIVSAFVSSSSTQGSARVTTQKEDNDFNPFVSFTPENLPLDLGGGAYKESTLPVPNVIRVDELVETRFDVVTYSTGNDGSVFRRREEFIAVSCECILKAPPGNEAGRRPTIWAGDEYTEVDFIDKPYGVKANNIQSPFCDTCCQDHHDGGTGTNDPSGDEGAIQYNPFRNDDDYVVAGTFAGDHKHFSKDRRGNLTLADAVDDVYVEACKMVRKDGFFRVGHDLRQEGLNVFQYDFLLTSGEIADYSAYVTGEVASYAAAMPDGYEGSPPVFSPPSRTADGDVAAATDLTAGYTYLPTALGAEFQQLNSRAVYLDYVSEDLRAVLTCLVGGGTADSCTSGDVILDLTGSVNPLELLPFYDVQLTKLNRWTERPTPNIPVDTTNEALATNNSHSRGVGSMQSNNGDSDVYSRGHRGVTGLTDTDAIDLRALPEVNEAKIQVIINNSNPPPPNGTVVTGLITSGVGGLQASNVVIEASGGAFCDRTVEGFICLVPNGTGSILTVSDYQKNNQTNTVACSYEATLPGTNASDNANNPITRFNLDDAEDTIIYQITIELNACLVPVL